MTLENSITGSIMISLKYSRNLSGDKTPGSRLSHIFMSAVYAIQPDVPSFQGRWFPDQGKGVGREIRH